MTTHIHNWTNASIGIAGWLIANARMYIQNMNEISVIITSILGIIMLTISIRTSVVKYRMTRLELRRMQRREDEEKRRSGIGGNAGMAKEDKNETT